jgi:putative ABC transport system permease protein
MNSTTQLVLLVFISLAVIGLLVARRRTLAKMAVRNIIRKRRFTVIIIAGLLVATAMISGALVVGDTFDYVNKQDTFIRTGAVDIIVSVRNPAGETSFFDQAIAYNLMDAIKNGSLPHLDGAQPAIRKSVAVKDLSSGLIFPSATIFGFDIQNTIEQLLDENGHPIALDDIDNDNVVLNKALADEVNAKVGDSLLMMPQTGVPATVRLSHIASDSGMARWQNSKLVFVKLSYAQTGMRLDPQTTSLEPKTINCIDVSNVGSVEKGYLVTDLALEDLKSTLPSGYTYYFETIKKDGIDASEASSEQTTQIFVIMSSFAIIAGVALIVNIFVMLAEERKPEMGISRAIGMQRRDLTQSFLFEGVLYALAAAAIGALAGLLIAALMMIAFSTVYGGGLAFTLHYDSNSLVVAACAGFLITLVTVAASSWRVSNLNIVRAIRDIPEPILAKSERRYTVTGVAMIVLGLLFALQGLSARQNLGLDIGAALVVFGIPLVTVRFVKPRIPFTLAGLLIIWWVLDPTDLKTRLFGELSGGMEMFIVAGVLLVAGGVVVVIFNSDLLLNGLVKIFGRKKSLLPVLEIAISYPMNKRFRTGLTLFIFALIMFTVSMMSMIASFQRESVDSVAQQFSGGFEIVGVSIKDMTKDDIDHGLGEMSYGSGIIDRVEVARTAAVEILRPDENDTIQYSMMGFSQTMLSDNQFSLSQRSKAYETDEDAWNAVASNSSLVIIDGSVVPNGIGLMGGIIAVDLGETLTVAMTDNHMVNLTVVGIMDQQFNMGIYTLDTFLQNESPANSQNLFYMSTAPNSPQAPTDVAKALEIEFASYGLRTYVVRDLVKDVMDTTSSVMQLMEIFLGMGLVVGTSGLGIITIRNVAERRQEIGVMRAIGFQRDMILKSFMLESSFVSLLGIILGVIFGLALSYRLWDWGGFSKNAAFVVPWGEILLLVVIAFGITLAATMPPARRASRLAPAEALRRVD